VTGWRVNSGRRSEQGRAAKTRHEDSTIDAKAGKVGKHDRHSARPLANARTLLPYDVAMPTTPQGRYPGLHVQLTCRTSFLVATRTDSGIRSVTFVMPSAGLHSHAFTQHPALAVAEAASHAAFALV
jgi:hypothetical protein